MRERPIIMQGESVRAILAGSKSQTRRVVTLPEGGAHDHDGWPLGRETLSDGRTPYTGDGGQPQRRVIPCPYGAPGDRLWVKEGWRPWFDESEYAVVQYRADGATRKPEGLDVATGWHFAHECDDATDESPWRSPLFMPRWASRITLEITEVRVQRVQEISREDAVAEGWDPEWRRADFVEQHRPVLWYSAAWDALNAKCGLPWAANPWVWAISFRPVEASK